MLDASRLSSIGDLFQEGFYLVPRYQREYVWENEDVDNLLKDIDRARETDRDYYFIGNLVLAKSATKDKKYEIVDGQQRLTTLFLVLSATLRRLEAAKQRGVSGATASVDLVKPLLLDSHLSAPGKFEKTLRVEPQYPPSKSLLYQLAELNTPDPRDITDLPARRLLKAYQRISAYIDSLTENQFASYWFYLLRRVSVLSIIADSRAEASVVYERLNSRGQSLEPPDLVKNRLLENATDEQFIAMSDDWKEMTSRLDDVKESYGRFLRYFLITKKNSKIRENDVLTWFDDEANGKMVSNNPVGFLNELRKQAELHSMFLRGETRTGVPNMYLKGIQSLSKRARQHLFILLPATSLPKHDQEKSIERLAEVAENVLFCSMLTDENTTKNEERFINWALEIQKVKNIVELESLVRHQIMPDYVQRFRHTVPAILRELPDRDVSSDVRRYLLARLTQYIEASYRGPENDMSKLERYTSKGFQVEHILPRSPSAEASDEFGVFDSDLVQVVEQLGNLTLLEEHLNKKIGNVGFQQKALVYATSAVLLTRALSPDQSSLENTLTAKGRAALDLVSRHSCWNIDEVTVRSERLTQLALTVWNLGTLVES